MLAVVTWDGGAGPLLGSPKTFDWHAPANWDGNVVPGPGDDVVLLVDDSATEVRASSDVTVGSLQSNVRLAILASGNVTIQDGLESTNEISVVGGSFLANGDTRVNGTSLVVSNGGSLRLPDAVEYVNTRTDNRDRFLKAEGSGSILALPNAATLTGATDFADDLFIQALGGGNVNLSSLVQVENGAAFFRADGIDSSIDLSSLESFNGYFSNTSSGFVASDGGAILSPNLTSIRDANITLDGTGTMGTGTVEVIEGQGTLSISGTAIDLSALEQMQDGQTIVDGVVQPFPELAVIDGRSLTVTGGGNISIANVVAYTNTHTDNGDRFLKAEGPGSVLALPNAATLTGATDFADDLFIQALAGGNVNLSSLVQVENGAAFFNADGIDSSIDLSSLESFDGYFSNTSSGFVASDGGAILSPTLISIRDANITLDGTGAMGTGTVEVIEGQGTLSISGTAIDLSALEQMQDGQTIVDGVVQPFPELAVIDGRSLTVTGGGNISIANVVSYANNHTDNNDRFLKAEGPGSVLALPNVATLTGATDFADDLFIQALAGGSVNLSSVEEVINGAAFFNADGIDSSIDLSSLESFDGYFNNTSSGFAVSDRGTISIGLDGQTTLRDANVNFDKRSTLNVGNLILTANASLFGEGTITGDLTNGSLSSNSDGTVVRPGGDDQAEIEVTGNYTQGLNGTLELSVNGLVAGIQHDELVVGGTVFLDGEIRLELGAFAPRAGNEFDVIQYAGREGMFSGYSGLAVSDSLTLSPYFRDTELSLIAGVPSTPSVVSITPTAGTVVNSSAVNIDVTFSELVIGLDESDLEISGVSTADAIVGLPLSIAGNQWRFPVSGLSNGPLEISLAPTSGDIVDTVGNPLPTFSASYIVSFDGSGNSAPIAGGTDQFTLRQDTVLRVNAPGVLEGDSDPNGDDLSAVLLESTDNGTLTLSPDGSFTYEPSPGFVGIDSFKYAANDGAIESNAQTVSISVTEDNGENRPPNAHRDSYSFVGLLTLDVEVGNGLLANDVDADGDSLTATLVKAPENGTLVLNPDGSFTYKANAGFVGRDAFTYLATDGELASAETVVSINVATLGVTVIDFEDAVRDEQVGGQYSGLGVIIDGPGLFSGRVLAEGDFGINDFSNSGNQVVHAGLRNEPTRIRFVEPGTTNPFSAESVRILFGDGDSDSETFQVEFFDSSDNLISGPIVATTQTHGVWIGIETVGDQQKIGSVLVTLLEESGSGVAFDDVHFQLTLDGSVDEIDQIFAAARSQLNDPHFDLNADGEIQDDDAELWISEVANTNRGDADLDGAVDFSDFLQLSANFGLEGGWASGDFDGDGRTGFSDFLALSANFGKARLA